MRVKALLDSESVVVAGNAALKQENRERVDRNRRGLSWAEPVDCNGHVSNRNENSYFDAHFAARIEPRISRSANSAALALSIASIIFCF